MGINVKEKERMGINAKKKERKKTVLGQNDLLRTKEKR